MEAVSNSLPPLDEGQINRLVRRFYARAAEDALLAPIFAAAIADWEAHFALLTDFWSHVLLGTSRYKGSPFPAHLGLPVEPEHFQRWLALFTVTAGECLPADAARRAIERANHMANSLQAGLFPWKLPDGRMSRHKPEGL